MRVSDGVVSVAPISRRGVQAVRISVRVYIYIFGWVHWSRLRLGGWLLGNKTVARRIHVMGVYLLSQSATEKQSQENKELTNLCAPCEFLKKMRLPCLIIIQSCYFHNGINKSFACSRCVMCISCSVYLISTYYVRKGSWASLS